MLACPIAFLALYNDMSYGIVQEFNRLFPI